MPLLLRALLLCVFVVGIVGSISIGIATRRVGRVYDVPPPPIVRATARDEVARGGRLFRTNCLDCHAGRSTPRGATVTATTAATASASAQASPSSRRPVGARVDGAPSFMGEIWAPNLTGDLETGIGAWSDADLARLLRNGLRRDGRYAATMPRFGRLADDDVAALIGFLRSPDPLLTPARNAVPRPGLGVAGTLALAFAAGVDASGPARIAMPPRGPSVAYGRYLASAVYSCVDCHTEGFVTTEEKLRSPMLLAGGQFHRTPDGETIYSTNLTSGEASGQRGQGGGGVRAAPTASDLLQTLTTGINSDGLVVRPPMPIFRALDADEASALFAYLRSVPPVARNPAGPVRTRVGANDPPDGQFVALGCARCHGAAPSPNSFAHLSASEIAARIRHPEVQHPDSQMPTYASVLDEASALRLANWLLAPHDSPARDSRL